MNYNKIKQNLFLNILTTICLVSFWGGVVYRVYSLNNIGVIISLILVIISFLIIQRFGVTVNSRRVFGQTQDSQITREIITKKNKIISNSLFIAYLLLFACGIYILYSNQVASSIVSPWQVVPGYFFAIYAMATALLLSIILTKKNTPTILIILHYFLSFSVALIIYKIGYGFDPFIHQATIDLIDKNGAVYPKPFYYLGQYALIIIFHKLTAIPLFWLDKLLIPALAAIFLPVMLLKIFKKWFQDNKVSLLLILLLLALPFSFFIITTPQNLAYLFLILALLLGLVCDNVFKLVAIYLLSLAAIIIQPIAGIPALLFSLALTAYHSHIKEIKKYFYILIFIASSISLPLAFYLFEKGNNTPPFIKRGLGGFKDGTFPNIIIPSQENFILNFIYLYGFNIKIIIGLIVLAGLVIAYRHRKTCKLFFIYFLMSSSLGISYLLTKKLPFYFLINYERNNYTDRILIIAALFIFPFVMVSLYGFIDKLLKQSKPIKIPFLIFIVIIITTSLYISYPRFDHYLNSRGYSVGQNDINAVHWIDKNTEEDYIVLANQQVSAAALREFGFAKYYNNDIFYYPIPTGGQMYQYYLDMVYKKPDRETMLKAMEFAGVKTGYFVLNKYWWAFPKLLEEAKMEAESWEEIDGGMIYIFKYVK